MKSRVLFYIGDFDVTIREFFTALAMLALYVTLGFFAHGKIVTAVLNRNLRYDNAYFIQDNETFHQAFETEENTDVFVYGKLDSVGSVSINSWRNNFAYNIPRSFDNIPGEYSSFRILKEHYTKHTRTVTYTDADGKSHTKIETYYTWDIVWNATIHVNEVIFASEKFSYETFDWPGSLCDRIGYDKIGDDRWFIYGYPTTCSGISFINITSKNIGTHNNIYLYENTENDCNKLRENLKWNCTGVLVGFWVTFLLIGVGLLILFVCLDNNWLNRGE